MYIIEFSDGTKIDFYPKRDKVFIKKINYWIPYGLSWILSKIQTSDQ